MKVAVRTNYISVGGKNRPNLLTEFFIFSPKVLWSFPVPGEYHELIFFSRRSFLYREKGNKVIERLFYMSLMEFTQINKCI